MWKKTSSSIKENKKCFQVLKKQLLQREFSSTTCILLFWFLEPHLFLRPPFFLPCRFIHRGRTGARTGKSCLLLTSASGSQGLLLSCSYLSGWSPHGISWRRPVCHGSSAWLWGGFVVLQLVGEGGARRGRGASMLLDVLAIFYSADNFRHFLKYQLWALRPFENVVYLGKIFSDPLSRSVTSLGISTVFSALLPNPIFIRSSFWKTSFDSYE